MSAALIFSTFDTYSFFISQEIYLHRSNIWKKDMGLFYDYFIQLLYVNT